MHLASCFCVENKSKYLGLNPQKGNSPIFKIHKIYIQQCFSYNGILRKILTYFFALAIQDYAIFVVIFTEVSIVTDSLYFAV